MRRDGAGTKWTSDGAYGSARGLVVGHAEKPGAGAFYPVPAPPPIVSTPLGPPRRERCRSHGFRPLALQPIHPARLRPRAGTLGRPPASPQPLEVPRGSGRIPTMLHTCQPPTDLRWHTIPGGNDAMSQDPWCCHPAGPVPSAGWAATTSPLPHTKRRRRCDSAFDSGFPDGFPVIAVHFWHANPP